MYSSLKIANELLWRSAADGRTMTPMQLVKLVYIAHGWSLAILERPLISDGVEAWQYGPVVPGVYYTFKEFGGSPISRTATSRDSESGAETVPRIGSGSVEQSEDKELLNKVWQAYRGYDGIALSKMTHEKGTPWDTVTNGGDDIDYHKPIPDGLIQSHYQEKRQTA